MDQNSIKYYDFCDRNSRCDNSSSIEALRKILQLFEKRDILVIIVAKNKSFRGYIYKVTKDTVYLSDNMVSEPNVFISICNIVRLNTMNAITDSNIIMQLSEKISAFISSDCSIDSCCGIEGISEVINCFKETNNADLLCFTLDTDINFPISNTNCFTRTQIIKANTDMVFAIRGNRIFIYPTCGICSLEIRPKSVPAT
jgi:hypothetical protein